MIDVKQPKRGESVDAGAALLSLERARHLQHRTRDARRGPAAVTCVQRYRRLWAVCLFLWTSAVLASDPSTDRKHPVDDNPKCMDRDGTSCVINDGPRTRIIVPVPQGAAAKPGSDSSGKDAAPSAPAAPASSIRGSK